MHIKNKKFIYIFIFFYVLSSYMGISHFHTDTNHSHTDCKICMNNSNLHNGDVSIEPASIFIPTGYVQDFPLKPDTIIYILTKGFYSQAPPLFI